MLIWLPLLSRQSPRAMPYHAADDIAAADGTFAVTMRYAQHSVQMPIHAVFVGRCFCRHNECRRRRYAYAICHAAYAIITSSARGALRHSEMLAMLIYAMIAFADTPCRYLHAATFSPCCAIFTLFAITLFIIDVIYYFTLPMRHDAAVIIFFAIDRPPVSSYHAHAVCCAIAGCCR